MGSRLRLSFGVSQAEVLDFVERDETVGSFLRRYKGRTFKEYARALCLFFNWLWKVKGIHLVPRDFLNLHLKKRSSPDVMERRWAVNLVAEFCRDNPELEGRSSSYRRVLFTAVKQFCHYHEAELTVAKNVLGDKVRRKYKTKALSVDAAKRILGILNQRDRTVCMVMLQSGMSIGDVLRKFNFMLDYVRSQVALGKERIRIEFDERKGNDFPYVTFISRDAIQELRKWFWERDKWIGNRKPSALAAKAIFITRNCEVFTVDKFEHGFSMQLTAKGIRNGAYSVRSHLFRQMFKTEARPPERNVDPDFVEFMMGHASGLRDNKLQSVGGVYDRTPEVHAEVVEKEYEKLEPWINIYSGRAAEATGLTEDEILQMKEIIKGIREKKIEIFFR